MSVGLPAGHDPLGSLLPLKQCSCPGVQEHVTSAGLGHTTRLGGHLSAYISSQRLTLPKCHYAVTVWWLVFSKKFAIWMSRYCCVWSSSLECGTMGQSRSAIYGCLVLSKKHIFMTNYKICKFKFCISSASWFYISF